MPKSEAHRPFPVRSFLLYSQKDAKVMHTKGSAEKTKRDDGRNGAHCGHLSAYESPFDINQPLPHLVREPEHSRVESQETLWSISKF